MLDLDSQCLRKFRLNCHFDRRYLSAQSLSYVVHQIVFNLKQIGIHYMVAIR